MSKIHASFPSPPRGTLLANSSASLETISRSTAYPFPVMYSFTYSVHSSGIVLHAPRLFASPATRHAPHRSPASNSGYSTISGRGNTRWKVGPTELESESESESEKENEMRSEKKKRKWNRKAEGTMV